MALESQENEGLTQRIQALQKEIRRVKLAGALLLALLLVLWLQRHRTLNAEEVVTRNLVLTDSNGQTRARMAVFPEGAGLEVYAASGERRVQLVGGGEEATLNLYLPVTAVREQAAVNFYHNDVLMSSFESDAAGGRLVLHSPADNGRASLSLHGTTASLTLTGAAEKVPKLQLEADQSHVCTALYGARESSAGASLCLNSPGLPSLELADLTGDRTAIGIPQAPDLNQEQKSAASVILKLKDGKILRLAPR